MIQGCHQTIRELIRYLPRGKNQSQEFHLSSGRNPIHRLYKRAYYYSYVTKLQSHSEPTTNTSSQATREKK